MAGLGFMGRKTGGLSFALTSIVMHIIWGMLLGIIYVPL